MNGKEIDRVGRFIEKSVKNVSYDGCLLVEEIMRFNPIRSGNVCFAIVNILPANAVMGHFILVLGKGKSMIIFDSFGLDVRQYSNFIAHFLDKYIGLGYKIIESRKRIQGNSSLVCGIYCLYFAFELAKRGLSSFHTIIHRTFNRNCNKNDRLIVKLAYQSFPLPKCVTTFCNGINDRKAYKRCIEETCKEIGIRKRVKKRERGGRS